MKHKTHTTLNAAYVFYYATDVAFSNTPGGSADVEEGRNKGKLGERLNALAGDMLTIAKQVSSTPV
jgi:glycylpeptide N-tetradecanoyltransferase